MKNKRKAQQVHFGIVENLPELYNGLIRVAKDGRVYRNKNDKWYLAPQNKNSRNGKYFTVSICENGKQTHLYVHRLVAEAYIPNPNKKEEVNHKDGNGHNNHVDNLEWVTSKENSVHASKSGMLRTLETLGKPCTICGEPTLRKNNICQACKYEFEIRKKRNIRNEAKALRIGETLTNMDTSHIPDKHIEILIAYMHGKTLSEIGNLYELTRQRVHQIVKTYIKN